LLWEWAVVVVQTKRFQTSCHAADRRSSGASDHLHGDRSGDAEGAEHADPQPPKDQFRAPARPDDRVQVIANGAGEPSYKINETSFNKSEIEPKLAEIFATRQEKVMLSKAMRRSTSARSPK